MPSRSFGPRRNALLAFGLALLAVGTWAGAAEEQTRSRTVWAVVVTVLAAVFAYRAWRGSRAI